MGYMNFFIFNAVLYYASSGKCGRNTKFTALLGVPVPWTETCEFYIQVAFYSMFAANIQSRVGMVHFDPRFHPILAKCTSGMRAQHRKLQAMYYLYRYTYETSDS